MARKYSHDKHGPDRHEIITLSTLVVMQGVVLAGANLLTGGSSVALTSPDWAKSVFGSLIGGSHQVVIFWWMGFAAILAFLLHKTRVGNWVFLMRLAIV